MSLDAAIQQAVTSALQKALDASLENSQREALTVPQISKEFGYPESMLRAAIRAGQLRHQKVGDDRRCIYYVTRAWVRDWQELTAEGGHRKGSSLRLEVA